MTSFIYLIINLQTGETYVGKANDPVARARSHMNKSCNPKLKNAMEKYGVHNFRFQVIEEHASEFEAYEAEEFWVDYLRMIGCQLYNLKSGGRGRFTISEELREKIRANTREIMNRPDVKAKIVEGRRNGKVPDRSNVKGCRRPRGSDFGLRVWETRRQRYGQSGLRKGSAT